MIKCFEVFFFVFFFFLVFFIDLFLFIGTIFTELGDRGHIILHSLLLVFDSLCCVFRNHTNTVNHLILESQFSVYPTNYICSSKVRRVVIFAVFYQTKDIQSWPLLSSFCLKQFLHIQEANNSLDLWKSLQKCLLCRLV